MTIGDYYRLLDLSPGCSAGEIKKAYRQKAREFHPDINHSPEAKDLFIIVTEAYEFLISNFERIARDREEFDRAMDDWRKFRQARSRRRARAYSQTTYTRFRNTNFYKTTRIFDGTTIIYSLVISLLVLFISVYGYIYDIHHPLPGVQKPTITALVLFIILGMILFTVSLVYLKAYSQASKKNKRSV